MTTNNDQKPKNTTEADSAVGVSCAAAAGYAEPPMKVSDALPEMLLAMDAMWGALTAAKEVLETLINCNDGRLLTMREALRKAAGHLEPLMRHTSNSANSPLAE